MRRLHLEAASDHVERLAKEHDPLGGVKELIWNALDSDATRVSIEIGTSDLGGVDRVIVRDNGLGITPEAAVTAFEQIGGSWKKRTERTLGLGRRMHGAAGQGRLRGFALGEHIRWTTVADGIDGRQRIDITASANSRNDFEISAPIKTTEETGTVFAAWGKQSQKLNQLLADSAIGRVNAEFATYLTVYSDIELIYNHQLVDPQSAIHRDERYPITFKAGDGTIEHAVLRVVEWTMKTTRELHLCDADGMTIDIANVGIQAPNFDFTAYVLWDKMPDHQGEYLLLEGTESDIFSLITSARDRLREHFKDRSREQRREVIDKWKADGTYPYKDEPQSDAERVERDTFDIVATTVHRHMPKPAKHQKVTLALIREAVKHQPENVHQILDEVFRLNNEDKAELGRLLNRTTLSSMIKASSSVSDRLDFLAALSHMVFDPEVRRVVKERSQIHKILENETWIFGDHYSLLVSDQALDRVLERHLSFLERADRAPEPVRREDGSIGIVDLMLSRARREHDRRQHLIVELKAPHVTAGPKEVEQIKGYAQAVAFDPQFGDVRTEWDFWLVTAKMTPVVKMEANQKDRKPGCILDYASDGAAIRVWVKSWSEIIEDCRGRLQYFREHLEHDPTVEHALTYLREHHLEYLPASLRLPEQRDPTPDDEVGASLA
ncbi:ATP-binding protein [Micromonospora aurantiaca (nom. illeg.)]|uniref:ATP-binding protein n=1 Tax=Micromonospora aurantiaca (nom. illeg.) TaxID=47850 RepID=UPI00159F2FAA|nr:ATP-binding protein [Micromonospora aurantiaca]